MNTPDLVIVRVFDAPRVRVWRAWTRPALVMRWWGPKGYSSPSCSIDLRVDGKYIFCMHSIKEEQDLYSTGTYKEIVPNERLAFTDSFSDEHGNIVSPEEYSMPEDFPEVLNVTVVLEDQEGGKTKMTLTHIGMPEAMHKLCAQSWNEIFDKLAEALKE